MGYAKGYVPGYGVKHTLHYSFVLVFYECTFQHTPGPRVWRAYPLAEGTCPHTRVHTRIWNIQDEHTRTRYWFECGFGGLRGVPLDISRCLGGGGGGGGGSTPRPYGRRTRRLFIYAYISMCMYIHSIDTSIYIYICWVYIYIHHPICALLSQHIVRNEHITL